MSRYLFLSVALLLFAFTFQAAADAENVFTDQGIGEETQLPVFEPTGWKPEPAGNRYRERAERAMADVTARLASGDEGRLIKQYERIIKFGTHPHNRAAALIGLGNLRYLNGEGDRAFRAYKEAVDRYSNLIPLDRVLAQEYRIATRQLQRPPSSFLGDVFSERSNTLAVEVYEHIIKSAPYSNWAALATYQAGTVERWLTNYSSSASYYRKLITRFSDSGDPAIRRLVGSGMVELARSLKAAAESSDGDSTLIAEARGQLQRFLRDYPDHTQRQAAIELLRELNELEAQQLLYLSGFYERTAHPRPEAARRYLDQILRDYADTEAAVLAQERLRAESRRKPEATDGTDATRAKEAAPGTDHTPAQSLTPSSPGGARAGAAGRGKEGEKWLLPLQDL